MRQLNRRDAKYTARRNRNRTWRSVWSGQSSAGLALNNPGTAGAGGWADTPGCDKAAEDCPHSKSFAGYECNRECASVFRGRARFSRSAPASWAMAVQSGKAALRRRWSSRLQTTLQIIAASLRFLRLLKVSDEQP